MRLSFLDHLETQAERMTEMMDRLEVDVVALAKAHRGSELSHARMTCLGCTRGEACQSWLDGQAAAPAPRAFCPNAALFEGYARMV